MKKNSKVFGRNEPLKKATGQSFGSQIFLRARHMETNMKVGLRSLKAIKQIQVFTSSL